MYNIILALLIALCTAGGTAASAEEVPTLVKFSEMIGHGMLGPTASVFEDVTGKMRAEEVINPATRPEFQPAPAKDILSFGYTRSAYWIWVSLSNDTPRRALRLLEVGYPLLDQLDLYQLKHDGLRKHTPTGDHVSFWERPLPHRTFVFPLRLEKGETLDLFLRVQTTSSMQIPLELWTEQSFFIDAQRSTLQIGIFIGTLLIMVAYNFFVFLSVRESDYLYYLLYVCCVAGVVVSIEGIGYEYLWPDSIYWQEVSTVFFTSGIFFFGALFFYYFLGLRQFGWLGHFTMGYAYVAAAMMTAAFFMPYFYAMRAAMGVALIGLLIMVLFSLELMRRGNVAVRFLISAFGIMVMGGVFMMLNKFNIIPRNALTENALLIGSALQVTLLSFALADRLQQEKKMRLRIQDEMLTQERSLRMAQEQVLKHERNALDAQHKALEMQHRANEMLERKVKERTRALEEVNERLREMSIRDSLTGIYNRKYLGEIFHAECLRAQENNTSLAVILFDVDYFKRINDTYGHVAGDDCLISVANAARSCLPRESDTLARYGGEEFCVLLPSTDAEGAMQVAERLRFAIANMLFQVEGQHVQVNASFGVAMRKPQSVADAKELLKQADIALYQSKSDGRNRVTLAS